MTAHGAGHTNAKATALDALWEDGMAVRREVLGAGYVDTSVQDANDFMMAFQHITTEWCWGYTWTRPGLDRKTRSLLNLAMLTALNRSPELRLHVRGALTNGVTIDEIKEVLLQTTIYCGIPAGLDAFKVANEVLKGMGAFASPSPAAAAAKPATVKSLWDDGLALRREVLGADYVDGSIHAANDFMMAFQHITTEWCWGYTWTRPGLARKTRSLLNLVMLTALNRPAELRLHVRGALANGVTVDEIKEVLLQASVYCGIPAGLDAFKSANEVLKETGAFNGGRIASPEVG